MANLKVTLVKSTIGAIPKHKRTVEALGLKKTGKTVVLPDNAATRGMAPIVDFTNVTFKFAISILPPYAIG